MIRRIYIMFPKAEQAEKAVEELTAIGIDKRQMHAVARPDIDLLSLPKATFRQQSDFGAKVEQFLWNLNLALFFLMLGLAVIALLAGAWIGFIICLFLLIISFAGGSYFASYIPHTHLKEFNSALRHGEVLLLVDVPKWQLGKVDKEIRKYHPEASCDGVGWVSEMLHT